MPAIQPASSAVAVLIVDDHPIVRRGLREIIEAEADLRVCGEAGDISEALRQVDTLKPDLAIIDISMKSGSGLELIKQIKSRKMNTKMLVSSMYDESLYAERALHAGAMGYINKEEAIKNIVSAIRQVLRGKIYLSEAMTSHMLQRARGGEQVGGSPVDVLSDRELEVFEMIGRGMTTRQIADRLFLSVKTIETHREGIKAKMHLKNSTELTRHAMQWVMENI